MNRIEARFGPGHVDYKEFPGRIPQVERLALWLSCGVFLNTAVHEGLVMQHNALTCATSQY